jgi:hypothetical protein
MAADNEPQEVIKYDTRPLISKGPFVFLALFMLQCDFFYGAPLNFVGRLVASSGERRHHFAGRPQRLDCGAPVTTTVLSAFARRGDKPTYGTDPLRMKLTV